jgi:hypothetical protein
LGAKSLLEIRDIIEGPGNRHFALVFTKVWRSLQLKAISMRMSTLTLSLALVIAAEISVASQAASAAGPQKSGGMPSFAIPSICKRVTDGVETPAGCVAGEQSAREQLNKVWSKYASAERSRCADLSSEGGLASYVELLTCLEVSDDAKKLSNE